MDRNEPSPLKSLVTAVILTTVVAMAADALLAVAAGRMPPSVFYNRERPVWDGLIVMLWLFGPMLASLAIGFAVRFREWRTYPLLMWLYGFAMFCVLFVEFYLVIPWHDMP